MVDDVATLGGKERKKQKSESKFKKGRTGYVWDGRREGGGIQYLEREGERAAGMFETLFRDRASAGVPQQSQRQQEEDDAKFF